MSESIARGPFIDLPVFNAIFPAEGAKAIPVTIDLRDTAIAGIVVDLSQAFQMKRIDLIQTIFIDNSRNNIAATFDIAMTNQRLVCPPLSQGYFPCLAPQDAKIRFSSLGATGIIYAYFLNIPVSPSVWSVNRGTPVYDGNGAQMVSDALLDSCVVGGAVSVRNYGFGSNDTVMPDVRGNLAYSAVMATTGTTLIATATPGLVVTGIQAYLSGNASLAVAGEYTVQLSLGGAVIVRGVAYLPAAAPASPGASFELLNLSGTNFSAKVISDTLNVIRSAALTSGNLHINVQYALTNFVG